MYIVEFEGSRGKTKVPTKAWIWEMTDRSILITGCSSGIGYDAAHTLVKRGWRVFATCRKETDCERLTAEGLESFRLDYQDEGSIGSAVSTVLDRTDGKLDALFNNGAYAIPGAVEDLSREAFRDIFETNLFGQIELTNLLLPSMRNHGHGRIIHNSSVLGFVSMPFRGAYCATKFALEALTNAQRQEYIGTDIKFILIEPGPIKTAFRDKSALQFEKWIDYPNAYRRDFYESEVKKRLYDRSQKPDRFELPPSAVTKKLIHALESQRPKARYMVTVPTYGANILNRLLPTRLLDAVLSAD